VKRVTSAALTREGETVPFPSCTLAAIERAGRSRRQKLVIGSRKFTTLISRIVEDHGEMACEIMRPLARRGWRTGGGKGEGGEGERQEEGTTISYCRYRARGFEEERADRILPPLTPLSLSLSLSLYASKYGKRTRRVAETRAKRIIARLHDILGRCVDFGESAANTNVLVV